MVKREKNVQVVKMNDQLLISFDLTKKEMVKILKTKKANLIIEKMNMDFHLQILKNEIARKNKEH